MSMGGGSDSSSEQYSIIQYTNPASAIAAGNLVAGASQEAANQSRVATNNAIGQMVSYYSQATQNFTPYASSGYQALVKMNQLMGMAPPQPGQAPIAPTAPTKSTVDDRQVYDYITANTQLSQGTSSVYTGVGAHMTPWDYKVGGPAGQLAGVAGHPNVALVDGVLKPTNWAGETGKDSFGNDLPDFQSEADWAAWQPGQAKGSGYTKEQLDQIRNYLYDTKYKDIDKSNQELYDTKYAAYQKDLANYNNLTSTYDTMKGQGQGTNGAYTAQQVQDYISNTPGYQNRLNSGLDAVSRAKSAAGLLGSGSLLKDLQSYGDRLAADTYQNELTNLANLAGQGQQAAQGIAQTQTNLGNNSGQLTYQAGQDTANSILAGAQAQANAVIQANQKFDRVLTGSSRSSSGGGLGGLGGIGQLAGFFSGGMGPGVIGA